MTKRYTITTIIILLLANISYAGQWNYAEWQTDITIHSDSSFTVRETQTVNDFESASFLKRNIELNGFNKVSDVKIFDANGILLKEDETDIQYNADKVRIKITPKQKKKKETWSIEYTVYGGIKFHEDYNELKWTIFPIDKQVSVDKAEVLLNLPQDVPTDKLEYHLFFSNSGSQIELPNCSVISGSILKYWAEDIGNKDNIVIVAKWPKGILWKDRWNIIKPFLWFIIPLAVSIFIFIKWWSSSQNPKTKRRIIPHSNPPEDISPAGLFALIDGKLGNKEIVATLIDLANRGYIRIIEREKSNQLTSYRHSLHKIMDYDDYSDLCEHERLLLRHIFTGQDLVPLENLRDILRRNNKRIIRSIWSELIKNKYIQRSPREIRRRYMINSAFFIVASPFAYMFGLNASLAIGLTGIIIILLGRKISPETQKGLDTKWYALGFRKHLNLEVKPNTKIGMKPELFSEYLPYAIVFNIEKDLANIFSEVPKSLPSWYYPSKNKTILSVMEFIDDFSSVIGGYSSGK